MLLEQYYHIKSLKKVKELSQDGIQIYCYKYKEDSVVKSKKGPKKGDYTMDEDFVAKICGECIAKLDELFETTDQQGKFHWMEI